MQINRFRGDTTPDEITLSDGNNPLNLTGCTALLTVNTLFNPIDTSTQVFQLVGVIDNPLSGVIKFIPTELDVDRVGFFYYDIQIKENGIPRTLVKDAYVFNQDITKD